MASQPPLEVVPFIIICISFPPVHTVEVIMQASTKEGIRNNYHQSNLFFSFFHVLCPSAARQPWHEECLTKYGAAPGMIICSSEIFAFVPPWRLLVVVIVAEAAAAFLCLSASRRRKRRRRKYGWVLGTRSLFSSLSSMDHYEAREKALLNEALALLRPLL